MLTGIAVCARCGRPLTVHFTAYKTSKGKQAREPRRNFYCSHKRGARPCPSGSAKRIQEDVLNAWMLKELAPLLALEMQERATTAGREASQQALAAAEARLKDAKEKETKKLTALIDVMDVEQFGSVAQALKADREAIERQVVELRAQAAATTTTIPALADQNSFASMPIAALKDAISRAVRWIAVSKEGITVLTSWGTYIGARFRPANTGNGEIVGVTYIDGVDALSCLDCIEWITRPGEFVCGRRDSLGNHNAKITDEQLLPGLTEQPAELSGGSFTETEECTTAA